MLSKRVLLPPASQAKEVEPATQ
jgi:hypothetical protein